MLNALMAVVFIGLPFAGPLIGYYTYSQSMGISENKYILYWTLSSLIIGIAAGLWILWKIAC